VNCPRCNRDDLTEEDFGVCRARPSGRNLYCRSCNRASVYALRKTLRERKVIQAMARQNAHPIRIFNFPPELKVLSAIKSGAKTQDEIARQSKLPFDELGLVLVKLIIEERKVVTRVTNEQREYFVAA
jgi:hypothetical protein